jgi:putative membrane protein
LYGKGEIKMPEAVMKNNRLVYSIIALISFVVLAFLFWLIYFKDSAAETSDTVASLPALNALLNSLSAVCLILGLRAIKASRQLVHKRFMLSALAFSALFLISYIIYHNLHGDTPFTGTGFIRPLYFFILISHIVLSAVMLPMILTTVYFALTGNFSKHPKIARYTFPIWLYVSVTGVLIFFMLNYWV